MGDVPSEVDQVKGALRADLRAAMVARDATATRVIRQALSAVENAEAVPHDDRPPTVGESGDVPRRVLTGGQIRDVLAREHAERAAAIQEYRELGVAASVDELEAEAEVLARYLDWEAPLPRRSCCAVSWALNWTQPPSKRGATARRIELWLHASPGSGVIPDVSRRR